MKEKKHLERIILHYRAICRNGDLSKRHFMYMFTEISEMIAPIVSKKEAIIINNNYLTELNKNYRSQITELENKQISNIHNRIGDLKMFKTMLQFCEKGATHKQKQVFTQMMQTIIEDNIKDLEIELYSTFNSDLPF